MEINLISFSDTFHFHSSFYCVIKYSKEKNCAAKKIRNFAGLFGQEHLMMLRCWILACGLQITHPWIE